MQTARSTFPRRRVIVAASASIAALAIAASAPAGAQQPQPAPAQSTNLGVMVVTPSQPRPRHAKKMHLEIKRPTLQFDLGANPQPDEPSPTQSAARRAPDAGPPAGQSNAARARGAQPRAGDPALPSTAAHARQPIERTRAQAVHVVRPRYPHHALLTGVAGSVTLRFTVTASGATRDIEVVSASPPRIFNRAAVRAVRQWRFKPATVNGKPTAAAVTKKVVFDPSSRPRRQASRPAPERQPPRHKTPRKHAAMGFPAGIQALKIVPPRYPPRAHRLQIGGSVTVKFTIGTDGKTHQIRILSANPPHTFNRAIRRAVLQWRFKPADTPTVITRTITFTPP